MHRILAVAIAAAALAGVAFAQTVVTDPTKTFSFEKPKGWPPLEDKSRPGAPIKEYVAGTADEECWFLQIPRENSAALKARDIIASWSKPIDAAAWSSASKSSRLLEGVAEVKSSAVDTSGLFPVQTAILQGKEHTVVAALHARPGLEVWVFCTAYDGKDHTAKLQQVAGSVTTPKDAAYKAEIDAGAAEDAAAAAAAAAAQEQAKGKGKNKNR
jgi:hypothetical protein